MKHTTLCFLIDRKENKILLGLKKRSLGKGKINGYGGKVEENETIEEAAIRETVEEIKVKISKENITKVGELSFFFPHSKEWFSKLLTHVFVATDWDGIPEETSEMKPEWFRIEDIPFEKMWQDDKHWLPLVLDKKKIIASFTFEKDSESIKEHFVRETQNFD